MKNNNKIKLLEEQIRHLEEEKLNLLSQDDQLALDNHIMGRLSDLDDMGRMSDMRTGKTKMTDLMPVNLQELDIDLQEDLEGDLQLMSEIKEKDQEIIKLRQELCDLRAK